MKQLIFNSVSKRFAEMLQEDMEFIGPVRLRDVEEAQQKIVSTIRRLKKTMRSLLAADVIRSLSKVWKAHQLHISEPWRPCLAAKPDTIAASAQIGHSKKLKARKQQFIYSKLAPKLTNCCRQL